MVHFHHDWLHWFALGLAIGCLGMSVFQFAMFCKRQAQSEFRRLARKNRKTMETAGLSEDDRPEPGQPDK